MFRTLVLTAIAMAGLLTVGPAPAATGRTPGAVTVSQNGSAQYQIALALPAGRRGLTPQLGLVYDSNGSRGVAGLGWSLAGASIISRCEKTVAQDGVAQGVRNQTTDGYCLDGNRLRLVGGTYGAAGSTYRTELNSFSRITAVGSAGNGPASFRVETRDGLVHYYGYTADSRIESLGQSTARAWAVNRIEDRQHNSITFSWGEDTSNGAVRLEAVRYTGSDVEEGPYTVDFQYTSRADVNVGYVAGSRVQEVHRSATLPRKRSPASMRSAAAARRSVPTRPPRTGLTAPAPRAAMRG